MCRFSPLAEQGASRRTIVRILYQNKTIISRGKKL